MAKLRYIGSDAVDVPVLGRSVKPDEVVEVPDDLIAGPITDDDGIIGWYGLQWPESLWTEVKPGKKTAAAPQDEE